MLQRLCLLLLVFLSGCATVDVQKEYSSLKDQDSLEPRYYNVTIVAHDGVKLRATVYQPHLQPGESAPLVISAHGFGGFRTSGQVSIYGKLIITGEATINAWKHDYWVISYDQRGFGDSGGNVEMMLPEFEPKDVSDIISWANDNLPRLSRQSPGDPVVGMVGESYGGGVQLMASIFDSRIDAIVPVDTWNNLSNLFAPNGVVKAYWGAILGVVATFSSGFDFPKLIEKPYSDLWGFSLTPEVDAALQLASPAHYCAQKQFPQADMLLIHGFTDSIASVNEAVANQQCSLQAGHDARLVAIQRGHKLPWPTQSVGGMPLFSTDKDVSCGDFKMNTLDLVQQWFDLKLKNKPEPVAIPKLCLTLPDEQAGVIAEQMQVGGSAFTFNQQTVNLIQTGWFEVVMDPLDRLVSFGIPRSNAPDASQQSVRGGFLRPLFIPLWVAREDTKMIGIPKIKLDVAGGSGDNKDVVFASIGVRQSGSVAVNVASQQYLPIVGNGLHQHHMQAISAMVNKDDTVGLVLQGYTGQYFFDPEGWFDRIKVDGEVELPLLSKGVNVSHVAH